MCRAEVTYHLSGSLCKMPATLGAKARVRKWVRKPLIPLGLVGILLLEHQTTVRAAWQSKPCS